MVGTDETREMVETGTVTATSLMSFVSHEERALIHDVELTATQQESL